MLSPLLTLAWRSAMSRRATIVWLVLAIALTTVSILGIERMRNKARENFAQAVSGTDLIIGPRSSATQLVLYSIFRVGEASANLGWPMAQAVAQHPAVAWTIPISLGDSHRGFAVVGTNDAYLKHYQYGDSQTLALAQGLWFKGIFEVVIGADVARQLGYAVGQKIVLSHGSGDVLGPDHADKPFTVAGVLKATGTPVDRSLHVSLQAIEAIHLGWQTGMPGASAAIPAEFVSKFDLNPKSVTALLVGLKSKVAVFEAQRYFNGLKEEPIMAILPGVALDQMWQLMGVAEKAMLAMAVLVGVVSLFGLIAVMLTGLAQRRRELAVLRSVGVTPLRLLTLLFLEGLLVTLLGCALGVVALAVFAYLSSHWLLTHYGFHLMGGQISAAEWIWFALLVAAGSLVSLVPGVRAYQQSLSDGLLVKN